MRQGDIIYKAKVIKPTLRVGEKDKVFEDPKRQKTENGILKHHEKERKKENKLKKNLDLEP